MKHESYSIYPNTAHVTHNTFVKTSLDKFCHIYYDASICSS